MIWLIAAIFIEPLNMEGVLKDDQLSQTREVDILGGREGWRQSQFRNGIQILYLL